MTGKVWKMTQVGFELRRSNMASVLITFCIYCTITILVAGNPVPKTSPTLTSSPEDHLLLAKPSQLTFKIGGRCEADVSIERIICRNLRSRADLPQRQPSFTGVQQAVFVNVSGDGDIMLEDFKSLFPNLVSLTITESPLSAASLINLEKTSTSKRYEMREELVPKSLLQDPHFAKRFNLNYFGNGDGTLNHNKPTQMSAVDSSNGSGGAGGQRRGERALISEQKNSNGLVDNDEKLTTDATGSDLDSGKKLPGGDYPNDNQISSEETNDIFPPPAPASSSENSESDPNFQKDAVQPAPPEPPQKLRRLVWPSIRYLNLSSNELTSSALPDILGNIFPNLEELYLADNYLGTLDQVRAAGADWTGLRKIDISGNPLDCTNLLWLETAGISLVRENETLCDKPPHQNKRKPILKVLHLLKKVSQECRVNCSCDIVYIWEQNHEIHSKTVVNCSNKGFLDFPDPDHLPRPTDTLDLSDNKITSMATFVDDPRYLDLNVMTLHLDDNQISSINILEGSDWFYQFQFFSIRRNQLTEVPVYVLENVFRQNNRLYQIDLSSNKFKCDCSTVSSFKVWLLKYSNQIGHIEDVRCASTNEQIRYMRMEQWCQVDSHETPFIDVLDLVSIVLAILIVAVVSKVYYDYWNFKTKGKLPWLVGKM